MRCEACHGIGEVLVDPLGNRVKRLRDAAMMVPCEACGGCGWSYCCSGEQPDAECWTKPDSAA